MSIFKKNEGDDEANQAGAFQVTIGKTLAFQLSTFYYLAAGLSFRQACKVLQETHQRTGLSKLSGVRESDVAKYIRAIAAINLHKMSFCYSPKNDGHLVLHLTALTSMDFPSLASA
jgi:hypothetical protein